MKKWYFFDFGTGQIRYIGEAEDFCEADARYTSGESGWLFDYNTLCELRDDIDKVLTQ